MLTTTTAATPRVDGHIANAEGGIIVRGDYYASGRYDSYNQNFVVASGLAIEGHKLEQFRDRSGKVRVAGAELQSCNCSGGLDISWLKSASPVYQISPSIKDYVLVEVPCVAVDYPNRNQDAFPHSELLKWRVAMSTMAYQTFRGKPTHIDHQNQDPTKAKGVIFDAMILPVLGKLHVVLLKGFDRSKDAQLAKQVQERARVGHSMGALVEKTRCSLPWCRFESNGRTTCEHVANGQGKGRIIQGHLVYEEMFDFYFIESSSVLDPAHLLALSGKIYA
jgi:hypothetical protein